MDEFEKQQIKENILAYFDQQPIYNFNVLFAYETQHRDMQFWQSITNHYAPNVIPYTIEGREGSGTLTKYLEVLEESFFTDYNFCICLDSDFRYLCGDSLTQSKKYVWQTFTHSIENHKCIPENLNRLVRERKHNETIDFDFCIFLENYSKAIYEVLIYWLYFQQNNLQQELLMTWPELKKHISLADRQSKIELSNHAFNETELIKQKAIEHIKSVDIKYKGTIDTKKLKIDLEKRFGINQSNAHFYIQGHIIYDSVRLVFTHIMTKIFESIKQSMHDKKAIPKFKKENDIGTLLSDSFRGCFIQKCEQMDKIGEQIKSYCEWKNI